jgi:ABC-type branched-subunit amino acid transport system substrate-binding protein
MASVGAAAGSAGAASTSSAPGVTSNSITVGTLSTQTGPISSNFASLIYGEKAYFDYVNAQGGINGRKILYKFALDDGGNPSQFTTLANTLVNQDHVFAVTGVATAFFTPNIFVEAGTPTYGYNVTENWNGPPNLFAAGGSVIYTPAVTPQVAFVARSAVKSPKIAILAYGISSSAAACQSAGAGLTAGGYDVVYTDYKVNYPGTTVATDIQRMKQAGANFVLSCMDVLGNVNMARAIKQYGANIKQMWLNGNDQTTLNTNQSLMQGVYFYIAHVPFGSASSYPGLKLYLTQMKKYEPAYAYDEVAIQGWESASLFATGVKLAGKNLTQANVVALTNKLTAFTAGGLTVPTNWTTAHSGHAPPYCGAYIQVKGDTYVPVLNKGNSVFNCFDSISAKKGPVFPLPAGTPNA